MVMREKDLSLSIKQRLSIYELAGNVLWYARLQAGRIRVGSYFVKMCDSGTPDYLALIRNRHDGITALFMELKSDTGKLRLEQKIFMEKYNRKEGIVVLTITDLKQLDDWIEKHSKDFIKLL